MNLRTPDEPGEGRYGFISLVLRELAFLPQLGFSVVLRESTRVRFESERVFVNVYHGRQSHAVGVELGLTRDGELYNLFEVFSACAPEDLDRARYQASDADELERGLRKVAHTMEEKCRLVLEGDESAFVKLREVAEQLRKAATQQAQFGAILSRADQAWDDKDWGAARSLYERAEPTLNSTQRRRLEYMRKKNSVR
jgi:hypothetical protein